MRKLGVLHLWDLSPAQAIALQKDLAGRVIRRGKVRAPRLVAGCDVSSSLFSRRARAGVVLLSFPDLAVVEEALSEGETSFPYVPGLLAFREGPLALQAFSRLTRRPDVVFFDGQGLAHPRRLGLASHLGLCLDLPAVGCAKSRFIGEYEEPREKRGAWTPLTDGSGVTIGAALRTRDKVKPMFVSIGHRLDLKEAIRLTLAVGGGYRVPEPTRLAHQLVSGSRRKR
ncbi:MAG: deoxyribonuclease V [Candidatus Aureabacteria bacterium]|nr:deoxyribonuclease V [Candidatus Auribacterota bacterium]